MATTEKRSLVEECKRLLEMQIEATNLLNKCYEHDPAVDSIFDYAANLINALEAWHVAFGQALTVMTMQDNIINPHCDLAKQCMTTLYLADAYLDMPDEKEEE